MSNRTWAFTEAKRRAMAMAGPYSVWQNNMADDYIVIAASAAPTTVRGKDASANWTLRATFQPNGDMSFGQPDFSAHFGALGSDREWPMYSFEGPSREVWGAISAALYERGYTEGEIKSWMQSKYARFALDSHLGDSLRALGRSYANDIIRTADVESLMESA